MKLQDILKEFMEGPLSEDCVPCTKKKQDLNEIDFKDKWSDVKYTCIDADTLVALLNKAVGGKKVDPKVADELQKKRKVGRRTISLMDPFIHGKAIPTDKGGDIDVDKFIAEITAEPNALVGSNGKMVKSSGSDSGSIFFKIGIPSVKGLGYDLEKKQFLNINTCPSAGECLMYCYTFMGGFIQYPATFLSQTRILNKMLNDPEGFEARIYDELTAKCKSNNKKGIKVIFRWNDAGDFFGKEYFAIMKRVSQKLLDAGYDFKSYIYTKNSELLLASSEDMPSNVKATFSQGADPKAKKIAQMWHGARSYTIPSDIFKDEIHRVVKGKDKDGKDITAYDYKGPSSVAKIKQGLAKEYGIDVNTILTFDEIMSKPEGKELIWSVIILPGQADNPASRDDVKNVLLAYH
jgi:Gene product 88